MNRQTKLEQLKPNLILPLLKGRLSHLEELSAQTIKKQLSMPEGKLRTTKNKGTFQYYCVSESSKKRTYIPKEKFSLIKKLAQKDYNKKLIKTCRLQIKQLKKFIRLSEKNSIATIYEKLPSARQTLVTPAILSDEQFSKEWLSLEFHHKAVDKASPYVTLKGESVRSKSEVIIANTLSQLGIPYRYEFPVALKSFDVHPDFYCLNIRTRKEFVWEHFGMMDSPEYAQNAVSKLNAYSESGYIPGVNFISTFETTSSPLNTKTVEKLAKELLL